jgi:hypothetical protein
MDAGISGREDVLAADIRNFKTSFRGGVKFMKEKLTRLSMVAGLLLVSSSQALADSNPPAPPSSPVLTSQILCKNGFTSVPLTADAEQSLPMKLVANLPCGQEVAVLSDMESYTVNVRTEDGRNGYVARLFLSAPTARASSSALENAPLTNGIALWQQGAPGSVSFPSSNKVVESLTANGITVQVSLQDTGWKLRANIAVMNASGQQVYILPKLLALTEVAPSRKPLRLQDPERLSTALNHQLLWTASTAGPVNGLQPDRSSAVNAAALNVTYRVSSKPSPNLLEQQQALEEIAAKNQAALVDMAQEIKTLSLRECTLKSGEKTAGAVWFDRDTKAADLVLRVPVGGTVFEFPLSFNRDK